MALVDGFFLLSNRTHLIKQSVSLYIVKAAFSVIGSRSIVSPVSRKNSTASRYSIACFKWSSSRSAACFNRFASDRNRFWSRISGTSSSVRSKYDTYTFLICTVAGATSSTGGTLMISVTTPAVPIDPMLLANSAGDTDLVGAIPRLLGRPLSPVAGFETLPATSPGTVRCCRDEGRLASVVGAAIVTAVVTTLEAFVELEFALLFAANSLPSTLGPALPGNTTAGTTTFSSFFFNFCFFVFSGTTTVGIVGGSISTGAGLSLAKSDSADDADGGSDRPDEDELLALEITVSLLRIFAVRDLREVDFFDTPIPSTDGMLIGGLMMPPISPPTPAPAPPVAYAGMAEELDNEDFFVGVEPSEAVLPDLRPPLPAPRPLATESASEVVLSFSNDCDRLRRASYRSSSLLLVELSRDSRSLPDPPKSLRFRFFFLATAARAVAGATPFAVVATSTGLLVTDDNRSVGSSFSSFLMPGGGDEALFSLGYGSCFREWAEVERPPPPPEMAVIGPSPLLALLLAFDRWSSSVSGGKGSFLIAAPDEDRSETAGDAMPSPTEPILSGRKGEEMEFSSCAWWCMLARW
uniref:Uncharacterized protein n=1 Tax=Anopheles atroparvus TaxID=41427 RepID=A0A182JIQ5_ANOAO